MNNFKDRQIGGKMARTNFIKKSRKEYTCNVCRKPIHIGEPYKFVEPHYMPLVRAHKSCRIPETMVSSSKMATIIDAVAAIDTSGNPEDISSALNDLAETARLVADEYQEGADNQRQYFPDSEKADESEEKANNLTEWADTLEEAAEEIEFKTDEIDELQAQLDSSENKDDSEELQNSIDSLKSEIGELADNAISEQPE